MKPKAGWLIRIAVALLVLAALMVLTDQRSSYKGTDEIVSGFAEQAGRKARDPFINTDRGDLLLFVFAVGGFGAGFASGYLWRDLFGPAGWKLSPGGEEPDVPPR